jgi:hypothetical protein
MVFSKRVKLLFKVSPSVPQLAVTDAAGQLLPSMLQTVLPERGGSWAAQ